MDANRLDQVSDVEWRLPASGPMRVPAILFSDEELLRDMDDNVLEQLRNVASLPGIVHAALAMPDAHSGYGFPVGGVGAFDPEAGGIVSAGGVGFDISCGVRTLLTGLSAADVRPRLAELVERLFAQVPAGVGSTGALRVAGRDMDAMLCGGAHWAVERGFGNPTDLARIEDGGCVGGAEPDAVSGEAKKRQLEEVGTLGAGNHYLEVQEVVEINDPGAAAAFGLRIGDALVGIHCGSRGLGHQIGTDYLKKMADDARRRGIRLPERELACAELDSALGRAYLGAMNSGINCALANRQVLTHLVRRVFADLFPGARLDVLYDVSHNTCKREEHDVDGRRRRLFVHRKGATRAFGPGHADLPPEFHAVGQPVLVGGSMGTASYVLAGCGGRAFASACHGAGRAMSRTQAAGRFNGREVTRSLAGRGILVRGHSARGLAEEAPDAYKDVAAVVRVTEAAGLARRVAMLRPLACVKG
jgi:tRNA-splicing ligase RtcB